MDYVVSSAIFLRTGIRHSVPSRKSLSKVLRTDGTLPGGVKLPPRRFAPLR